MPQCDDNQEMEAVTAFMEPQWHAVTPEILYLRGTITQDKIDELIRHILCMNSEEDQTEAINLIINSDGGDLTAAYTLISVMRASNIPINTIAMGTCASAALMIAMAGDTCYVDKYCNVMSHMFSTAYNVMSKPSDISVWMKSLDLVRKNMMDHYIESTGLNENEIKSYLLHENNDIHLTATEAISYGLFDAYYESYQDIHSSTRTKETE